jgi:hypothetical protein
MKTEMDIPLSEYAKEQWEMLKERNKFGAENWMLFFLMAFLLLVCILAKGYYPAIGFSCGLIIFFITFRHYRKKYRRERKTGLEKILAANARDYADSVRLREFLTKLALAKVDDFPVTEGFTEDVWKPFRVEHFVSNSLRAEIEGTMKLSGFCFIFASLSGRFSGTLKGETVPNLLDLSSMLFLKNKNETLRVIIPNWRVTKQIFGETMANFIKSVLRNSHVNVVLEQFSPSDEVLLGPLSHPQFIDFLDSSCELPLRERPDVKVKGRIIQEGIILATALEVNGKEKIFLPTGFFQELNSNVSGILEWKNGNEQKMINM